MPPAADERSGLLILKVRVAVPPDARAMTRLAATITTTLDLASRDEEMQTIAGTVDEIVVAVRRWLDAFARESTE